MFIKKQEHKLKKIYLTCFLLSCHKGTSPLFELKITEQEQMVIAAKIENLEALSQLVESHGTEVKDEADRTLLTIAAEMGNIKTVRFLLRYNAKVDACCERGRTPLYSAVSASKSNICQILLEAGANPNIKTKRGFSSLHRAAYNGNAEIVGMILSNGKADKSLKNGNGKTFVDLAREGKKDQVLSLLGEKLTFPKVSVSSPSTSSMQSLAPPPIPLRPRSLSNSSRPPTPSLDFAISAKDIDEIIISGQEREFKDSSGNTVLHYIAAIGNTEQAKIVLKCKINIDQRNSKSETPLHLALTMHNNEVARLLVGSRADIDSSVTFMGHTPLIISTIVGNKEGVRMLIEAGADIDSETEDGSNYGRTGILCAAQRNYDEIVGIYLAKGASRLTKKDFLLRNMAKVTETLLKIANSAAVEFAGAPDLSDYINFVPEIEKQKEALFKKIIKIYQQGEWVIYKGSIEDKSDLKQYKKAIARIGDFVKKSRKELSSNLIYLSKCVQSSLSDERTRTIEQIKNKVDTVIKIYVEDLVDFQSKTERFYIEKMHPIERGSIKADQHSMDSFREMYQKMMESKSRLESTMQMVLREIRSIKR